MVLPLPVLLIEDVEVAQELAQRALQPYAHSFALTITPDARQAITLLHNSTPQFALIVLDLDLPMRSGFEFLAHLCQQAPYSVIPVILLIGFSIQLEQLQAERYQIANYLD